MLLLLFFTTVLASTCHISTDEIGRNWAYSLTLNANQTNISQNNYQYITNLRYTDWSIAFRPLTWNNSAICCSDPTIFPFYFNDSLISADTNSLNLSFIPPTLFEEPQSSGLQFKTNNTLYGSFRLNVSISLSPGTMFGFYFFNSTTNEIDIEILTRQLNYVNVALQPIVRNTKGDSLNITNQLLLLNSTVDNVHEYRFDWLPTTVDFYLDGIYRSSVTENIPQNPGTVYIRIDSNNNTHWSGIFPNATTTASIIGLQFYYNTSVFNCTNPIKIPHVHPIAISNASRFSIPFWFILIFLLI